MQESSVHSSVGASAWQVASWAILVAMASACGGDETAVVEQAGTRGQVYASCSDCADHQVCSISDEGEVTCDGSCEPGFAWQPTDATCVPTVESSCQEDSPASIVAACDTLGRECIDDDEGAHCDPGCPEGQLRRGSRCVSPRGCDELPCEERGRICVAASATEDAHCGACRAGYERESGTCRAVDDDPCLDACGRNQACASPEGRCLESCTGGWVWDAMLGACREPLRCADVCEDGQECIESEGRDASCVASSCPGGEGLTADGMCRACTPAPECDAREGATGEILHTPTGCACEPEDGWFINSSGEPQACDQDGDGWITTEAAGLIEGDADGRTQRCSVRVVDRILLRSDAGDEREVSLDEPMRLYERPINDGTSSARDHDYPDDDYGAFTPRALNSLTKACVLPSGDFNQNGWPDSREHARLEPELPEAEQETVLPYFNVYQRFSYFVELHRGWYSGPTDGTGPGTYHIAERVRTGETFPFAYDEQADLGWQTCLRRVDRAYRDDVRFEAGAGADFAEFGEAWDDRVGRGMLHHSQFRCVNTVSRRVFDDLHPGQPELAVVASTEGGGEFLWSEPDEETPSPRTWLRNRCRVVGHDSQRGGPSVNPGLPRLDCQPTRDLADLDGHDRLTWVAIEYVNGEGQQDVYRRGCINECAEHDRLPASRHCEAPPTEDAYGCWAESEQFGALACCEPGSTDPNGRPCGTAPPDVASECDPAVVDQPDLEGVDADCDGIDGEREESVFVSQRHGNDRNDGSPDAPVRTIAAGIALAEADQRPVLIATGTYRESIALVSGVSLFGGYDDEADWTRPAGAFSTIVAGATAIAGVGLSAPLELQRLEVFAANAEEPGDGSYAVRLADAPVQVVIRGCNLTAGRGAAGLDGAAGTPGERGGDGTDASSRTPGEGGVSSCDVPGGAGGTGGRSDGNAGKPGEQGASAPDGARGGRGGAGGCAGGSCDSQDYPCSAPQGSAVAGQPVLMAGAPGQRAPEALRLRPETGASRSGDGGAGDPGQPGAGGGGGGGGGGHRGGWPFDCGDRPGSAGGGGGAGGCGATPGGGGGGGGASVAIANHGAPLEVVATRMRTAAGGHGGGGGAGAAGGEGGLGGVGAAGRNSAGGGADGAVGGAGSASGAGAGGNGGASVCIAYVGAAPAVSDSPCEHGAGGQPGPGGQGPSGPAPEGHPGVTGALVEGNQQ